MTGNNHKAIVLQNRDLHLLRELSVMRVIDREQAKRVAGFRSTTRANNRLLLLTNQGLLRRYYLGTALGGKKALYALSQAGAKLVDVPYVGPRRGRDQILVADFFVAHQLLVNEIYCAVKYPSKPIGDYTFRRWVNFSKPIESGTSLIPDGYFEVSTPSKTIAAFLEVDLGHEGNAVWKAKVQTYLRYALSGHFTTQFHQPQFRVLVVTNSERRMRWLRANVAAATGKVFWFYTFDSINRDGFWSPVWLRPKGDQCQPLI